MRKTVVVTDEAPTIRALLRLILEDEGYSVVESPDETATFDLLRSSPEQLVVLLNTLGGVEVLQAAAREAAIGRHAFVLVTALADHLPPIWRHLVAELHVPVVAKPFEIAVLLTAVASAHDGAPAHMVR